MIYPVTKQPAPESVDNNLWDIEGAEGHATCLRYVMLRRPDAHPIWHDYMMTLIHLRPVEGYPPAVLANSNCTHELMCYALDPNYDNQPTGPHEQRFLTPPNLVYQFEGLTDEQALEVFSAYLKCMARRTCSPDTDWRSVQRALLRGITNEVLKGIKEHPISDVVVEDKS